MLKSEDRKERDIGMTILKLVPSFLFSINAKVDLKFEDEDFGEIAKHPMAAPVLESFEDLFKKFVK